MMGVNHVYRSRVVIEVAGTKMDVRHEYDGDLAGAAVRLFELLSESDRQLLLGLLAGRFCLNCGRDDPMCPCENDE
jgi:hypothetical protein